MPFGRCGTHIQLQSGMSGQWKDSLQMWGIQLQRFLGRETKGNESANAGGLRDVPWLALKNRAIAVTFRLPSELSLLSVLEEGVVIPSCMER